MAVYSCNIPIRYTCQLQSKDTIIKYTIYASPDGTTFETIHTGAIYPFSDSEVAQINIAPICRQYLTTWYEVYAPDSLLIAFLPVMDKQGPMMTFRIEVEQIDSSGNPSMDTQDYIVKYDYNTDYVSVLPDAGELNDLIEMKAVRGQWLPICNYTSASATISVNGTGGTASPVTGTGFAIWNGMVPLNASSAYTQSTIGGTTYPRKNYSVTMPCQNQYVLYYVNKKGGLDWLLVRGEPVISYEAERIDFRSLRQRENRIDFENSYIRQNISKRYQLTTNMLNTEQSDKLDNVFFSPKMWLLRVSDQTMNSVIMVDTSLTRKTYPRDKDLTYTFTVQESQLQLRK